MKASVRSSLSLTGRPGTLEEKGFLLQFLRANSKRTRAADKRSPLRIGGVTRVA